MIPHHHIMSPPPSPDTTSDRIVFKPLILATIGLLCLISVTRSYLLLVHNTLHVVPPPTFSIYSADFLCFYTAAQVGLHNLVAMYDPSTIFAAQSALTSVVGAANPKYLYVYPPFVGMLFQPLTGLSYINAYFIWLLISFTGVTLTTHLFLPRNWSSLRRWTFSLLIPAAFPFFSLNALMSGQTTALGIVTLGVAITMKRNNPWWAGVVFSCGLYKPPLFLVFAVLCALKRDWRFLAGALVGSLVILGVSTATLGTEPFIAFGHSALRYVYGSTLIDGTNLPPGKGMGLASALMCLTASPKIGWPLFGVCAIAMLFTHYTLMKKAPREHEPHAHYETCSAIILTYFLSLQAINYDAGLLLIPCILLFLTLKDSPRSKLLLLVSLTFIMLAGTMSTENGDSVSAGFLAVAILWVAVVVSWRHHVSANEHA